jgi:hypothetical protein
MGVAIVAANRFGVKYTGAGLVNPQAQQLFTYSDGFSH